MKNKIAICYYGPPRTLRQTYKSHVEHIFKPLNAFGLVYKIFVHTWCFKGKQYVRTRPIDALVDYEAYRLINPDIYKKDNQDDFVASLDMSRYFYKEVWGKQGKDVPPTEEPEEEPFKNILNYLCSLESQKRVTRMVNNSFRYVMYIRPDAGFLNPLDCDKIVDLKDKQIIIPNEHHWKGVNDRFAILLRSDAQNYSKRINYLAKYRKNHGRIVSEKYTKYFIIENQMQIGFSDIKFNLVRPKRSLREWFFYYFYRLKGQLKRSVHFELFFGKMPVF